ncbi:S1 family peptidase [Streptomyces sp. XM4193]|uniref:S1 family peptidase n=1 Tax=Streptomyces sp. XM4193 TaxID=2929782 RepID=UPI001FF8C581|nr:S1 family peptidase [Streptomyces sp. XM4193]MCK1799075.1 S1 family peptidase [Streptomyces sp. XM4193]
MRTRRINKRRMTIAGAGVAALVAGSFTVANANAAEPVFTADTLTSSAAGELATTLEGKLGADTAAGTYYDAESKKLVVNVTSESAVKTVQNAGAEAKVVEHSMAELKTAKSAIDKADIVGTARSVDPKTNKVVVTADKTVSKAKFAELEKLVTAQNGKAELKRSAGEFSLRIQGGDAIYSSGARCSLGFNVTKGGESYFVTAGHCGSVGSSWSDSSGGSAIGTMEESTFPGSDQALVKYEGGVDAPSSVNLYDGGSQDITGAREATVGEEVQRSGSTTQVHGGSVEAVDASVSYPEGTVNGLIQTDVCAEPGDSGGSLFAGSDALGMTSGGSGNCSSGGQTFYGPVAKALADYGAEIG